MKDMKAIDFKKLKAGAKALNEAVNGDSGDNLLAEDAQIVIAGANKVNLVAAFTGAVEGLEEEAQAFLPDDVVTFYNEIIGDEAAAGDTEAGADTEAGKTEKTDKQKKAEKAEKAKGKNKGKPRSCYDHILDAKSGQLDEAFKKGGTKDEIMASCDVDARRFTSHWKHLVEDLGLTPLVKEKKDGKAGDTHHKIKEASYVKE